MKSRILLIFTGLIGLWILLLVRATYLQTFPDDRIKNLKERQFQTVITLQSRRGAIVDRKGRELALSTSAESIYADPKLLENKKLLSKKLAKALGVSKESIYAKIKDKDKRFIWIARLIPKEISAEIKSWNIRGLSAVEEFRRVYPNDSLLAHTLGVVGTEGQGLEGLELQYDQLLRGNKKKISIRRDARGRPLIADGMMFADNPDGVELHLTIDSEMQHMLEGELAQSITEFEADQAFGVILDVQTSAVLAMVNTPAFDANQAGKVPPEVRRNRITNDAFEPGSTLKTFTVATALKEKMIAPNSKFNTENGRMKVGDRVIREAESSHNWSNLTVSEILAYSSNVGVTKIGFEIGAQSLRQGLSDFGFGLRTGVDLPGEAHGSLQTLPWNQHLLANVSFGQGVAVTPLQLANAYAAIANGGVLNTPFIVRAQRDPETGELTETKVKPIRRVLSEAEAESMRMMLMSATAPGGTGIMANVAGFLIGGKTGTAQKVNPVGRGYLHGAYISSFAGFIPASDPRFVIYVAVDNPKKTSIYGGVVAAPVFSRVASYAVRMEGLAPMMLTEKNLLPGSAFKTTEIKNPQKLEPKTLAKKKGVKKVDLITAKLTPKNKARVPAVATPAVLTADDLVHQAPPGELKTMPDLKNLSLREVLQRLSGQDVEIKVSGSGVVSETEPAAGIDIPENKKVSIHLK